MGGILVIALSPAISSRLVSGQFDFFDVIIAFELFRDLSLPVSKHILFYMVTNAQLICFVDHAKYYKSFLILIN